LVDIEVDGFDPKSVTLFLASVVEKSGGGGGLFLQNKKTQKKKKKKKNMGVFFVKRFEKNAGGGEIELLKYQVTNKD